MDWFLTWLWHGIALTLLVSGALGLTRRVNASVRYAVWWAALVGVMMLGWVTTAGTAESPAEVVRSADAQIAPFVLALPPVPAWLNIALLAAWMMLAAIGLIRLAGAVMRLRQVRRKCRPIPAHRENRLPMWRSWRDTGRRTRLMVSEAASVASVLGLVRPVIVLPRRLLNAVTDHELDQIVLHEHAHVQRWDDWARLAQAIVEAVCPFHPAVRWIGRSLDLEREIACDERVVARSGAPRAYADCLMRIAEWTLAHPAPAVAPGIHGAGRMLVPRVERLLAPRPYQGRAISRAALAAGIGLVAAVVLQLRLLPPLIAERAAGDVAAVSASEEPAVIASRAPDVLPGPQPSLPGGTALSPSPEPRSSARASRRAATLSSRAEADPVPLRQVYTETAIPDPAVTSPPADVSDVSEEIATPFLPSIAEAPAHGAATELMSANEVSRVDEPRPAGTGSRKRVGLDFRGLWRDTAGAGIAFGVRAQESGLAVASTIMRLGRSIGRAF